jgi:hypothetical protein
MAFVSLFIEYYIANIIILYQEGQVPPVPEASITRANRLTGRAATDRIGLVRTTQ